MANNKEIVVNVSIPRSSSIIWEHWTNPNHIIQWNFATDQWHCPRAENDLKPGGKFSFRMEARDGSMGFDYCGTYSEVVPNEFLVFHLDDGRKVTVKFNETNGQTDVIETFEVEDLNTIDQQKAGWQSILNNFKSYVKSI